MNITCPLMCLMRNFCSHLLLADVDVDELDGPRPLSRMPEVAWSLRRHLASRLRLKQPEDKPPRRVRVNLSVTETDFVVLEDVMALDSNAVVLKVVREEGWEGSWQRVGSVWLRVGKEWQGVGREWWRVGGSGRGCG